MKPISDSNEILRLIAEGWEFGRFEPCSSRGSSRYMLQKPGLCRGGEAKAVHKATANKMVRLGLVKEVRRREDPFWLTRYEDATFDAVQV